MATGDITGVEISPSGAEPFGACADIEVEGFTTGMTIDFGSGRGNPLAKANLGSATIVFTVVSEGYDNTGALGTIERTVYATEIVRQPYPNETSNEESSTAGGAKIRVALSDFVYDDDNTGAGKSGTAPTVTIAAGAIRNDGGSSENSASATDLGCTNSSTLDYPKVIGNWAWPGYRTVGATADLEFVAFHRFAQNRSPVACVRFDLDDESTNNVNTTVTALTISDRGEPNTVQVYAADLSTSSLTQGDQLTARARAYPWVGDADSVLDTGDGTNTMPTPLYAPQYLRCDKSTAWGAFARVDGTSGNDGTGAVYSTEAAAESGNAYQTVAAAITALQSYHNTNYSHNDAGGGTILLEDGTYAINTTNGGSMTEWLAIKPASGSSKANAVFQADGSNARLPTKLKLDGVTFSGSGFFAGYNADQLWMHDCALNTAGILTFYETPASYATICSGTMANGFQGFSSTVSSWAIVRGCDLDAVAYAYCILGNDGIRIDVSAYTPTQDNSIVAFNSAFSVANWWSNELWNGAGISHGFALVQNVIESIDASQPLLQLAAGATSDVTNHVIMWHNTLVGQRCNLGYNDIGTTSKAQRNWSQIGNCLDAWNNKDDTFGTQNANRTGSWPVGYNVGTFDCVHEGDSGAGAFRGEYDGLGTVWGSAVAYTNDLSGSGGGGGGTYTLDAGSNAIDLVTQRLPIRYDIAGNERDAAATAAGAYWDASEAPSGGLGIPIAFRYYQTQQGR